MRGFGPEGLTPEQEERFRIQREQIASKGKKAQKRKVKPDKRANCKQGKELARENQRVRRNQIAEKQERIEKEKARPSEKFCRKNI